MGDDTERQYDGANLCQHGKPAFNCPICEGPPEVRLRALLEEVKLPSSVTRRVTSLTDLSQVAAYLLQIAGSLDKVIVAVGQPATLRYLMGALSGPPTYALSLESMEPTLSTFFREPKNRILVAPARALSGLRLPGNYMALLEIEGYPPAVRIQAEGRILRIGQEHPVTIDYIVEPGTTEELLAQRIVLEGA